MAAIPFRTGARVALDGNGIRIDREGRTSKIVDRVEQASFSGAGRGCRVRT